MRRKFELVMRDDGDIEIWETTGGDYRRVRHRSYNMGDDLRRNLMEEFDALQKMEEEQ